MIGMSIVIDKSISRNTKTVDYAYDMAVDICDIIHDTGFNAEYNILKKVLWDRSPQGSREMMMARFAQSHHMTIHMLEAVLELIQMWRSCRDHYHVELS